MLKINNVTFILGGLLLLAPCLVMGQTKNSSSTSSPYSRYGIGTLSGYSLGRSEAMGGIGIGIRNDAQINAGNPASYTSVDSLSFLTEFGLSSRFTEYKTDTARNGSNSVNFDYLAFSFPVKKWWAVAFGMLPVSQKGYTINKSNINPVDSVSTSTNFNGEGTLTKVFIGNAFNIGKHLSVGVNVWYLFGNLIDQTYIYFTDAKVIGYGTASNFYDYLSSNSLSVHNFGVSTGVQYHFQTKKKNSWTIGAVFDPKQNIKAGYVLHEERVLFRNSTTQSPIVDTINHVTSNNNGLSLPLSYGAGFSYTVKNKMVFGADVYHQQWSEATFLGSTQQYLTDRTRYSAGFEITPEESSIKSYWARTKYRAGLFYENSYLMLNGRQINGYGITLGLGMPFPRSRSTFNISAELGQLGTTQDNLIKETYAKFTLHILLYDRWFMKRKID
jgi:hypothetical protein